MDTNDGAVHVLPAGRIVAQPMADVFAAAGESGSTDDDAPLPSHTLHRPVN